MLIIRISECTDGREKVIEISDKDVAVALADAPSPALADQPRFIKYLDSQALPEDAENWNIVFDSTTGLMWTAEDIAVPNWAAAEKACSDLRTGGSDEWRWPTIQERLSIADYTRTEPAMNKTFFRVPGSDWHWTSTRYAGKPSSGAWCVILYDGNAYIYGQGLSGRVLACRHAESALRQWERLHLRGDHARGKPADFRNVRSVWASYSGHFERANAWRLRQRFLSRFPWLEQVCIPSHFSYRLEGRTLNVEINSCN